VRLPDALHQGSAVIADGRLSGDTVRNKYGFNGECPRPGGAPRPFRIRPDPFASSEDAGIRRRSAPGVRRSRGRQTSSHGVSDSIARRRPRSMPVDVTGDPAMRTLGWQAAWTCCVCRRPTGYEAGWAALRRCPASASAGDDSVGWGCGNRAFTTSSVDVVQLWTGREKHTAGDAPSPPETPARSSPGIERRRVLQRTNRPQQYGMNWLSTLPEGSQSTAALCSTPGLNKRKIETRKHRRECEIDPSPKRKPNTRNLDFAPRATATSIVQRQLPPCPSADELGGACRPTTGK
jgi:hypothetical protein